MDDKDTNDAGLPASLAARLAAELQPLLPTPERVLAMREKLFQRVRAEAGQPAAAARSGAAKSQHLTLRSDEGRWLTLAPGIRMKPLNREHGMLSYLLELAPGESLPAHDHAEDEECMVLAGDVWLGDTHAHAGDYHLARKGIPHGRIYTEGGCTLFLRGARPELPRAGV